MERYIEQLIEDLHEVTRNMKLPHRISEETGADPYYDVTLEDFSYIDEYLYGDKIPVSSITGIALELLPPADLLSNEQQALLATELENLLMYFHFYLDFPEDYPDHLRYSFILNFWKEEHVPMSIGEGHFNFCDYEEEHCPFPGYCDSCRIVAEQMILDEQNNTSATNDYDLDIHFLLPTNEEPEDFLRRRDQEKRDHQPDVDPERE